MFSPSSANLAVVGFPTSLQPFDIAYLPRESSDTKMRQLLTHRGSDHGLKPSHPVAIVTHDRCGRSVGPVLPHPRSRSEASANEPRTNDKHNERRVVAAGVGPGELEADTYPGKAAMRIIRGSLALTNELERRVMMDNRGPDRRLSEDIGLEKITADVNGREASSPSKKLKFGIDSILAIGSKTSEKTDRNNNKDGHHATPSQLTAHWNCDVAINRGVDVKRGSEIYDYKSPAHPVSKPALRRPISGLSSPPASCALWGGGATQVLLADGRWDGAPSRLVEVGPTGWGLRNKSREYQDLAPHHNPYQLVRNAELGNAHPPYALRTALPPAHHHHPTLPRSYHHMHPVVHVPSSRPPHFQNGGGGDLGVKAHTLGVNGGILGCGSGGIGALGSGGHKRKRSWSRAVFTSLQRKGLEKRFEIQKYVNKPERRQLASALGLSDAQVKVWFQNRRMKWRHSQQFKRSPHQEQQHSTQQQDQETEQPEENAFNSDSDESSIRLSSTTPDIKLGNGDATFEVGAIFIANADDSGADNNGSCDDDVDDSQK